MASTAKVENVVKPPQKPVPKRMRRCVLLVKLVTRAKSKQPKTLVAKVLQTDHPLAAPNLEIPNLHVAPTPPPRHANSASGTARRMLALRDRWRQATVPASTRAQEVVAEFRP